MPKLFIFIYCYFLSCIISQAQDASYSDLKSIQLQLQQKQPDTTRVLLLISLSRAYLHISLDSSYFYADVAEKLVRQINWRKGYYRNLTLKGLINEEAGNYAEALRLFHLVLTEDGENHDMNGVAVDKLNMSNTFFSMNDPKQGWSYLLQSKTMMEELNDPFHQLNYVLYSIGSKFLYSQKYDSAKKYFTEALSYAEQDNSVIYVKLGDTYFGMSDYDRSYENYMLAVKGAIESGNKHTYALSCVGVSKLQEKWGRNDSAIGYAYTAMYYLDQIGEPTGKIYTANLLASLYEKDTAQNGKMKLDSSIKYLKMAMHLKDSVFSQEAARKNQFQDLVNKQKEREREQAKEEEKRKQKSLMQIVGIGAFIPLFFGLVLWLGKVKINKRILTFMAALSLLFLFEFITLLLHPVFGEMTHESPFQMFLLLVLVASILVPMHHKSEKWLRSKLEDTKKIHDSSPSVESPTEKLPSINP